MTQVILPSRLHNMSRLFAPEIFSLDLSSSHGLNLLPLGRDLHPSR
jgi:hypothetical protein